MEQPRGEIVIYETDNGKSALEVRLDKDTVWLTQRQMASLFDKDTDTVGLHIRNIYNEGELEKDPTTEESSVVQSEGSRNVLRVVRLYNLDVIISVGYRVKSKRGTQFRQWATSVLRDHIIKGYSINQRRLSEQADHYRELQEAVRLIGEVLFQQALNAPQTKGLLQVIIDYAYALSVLDDYDHQQLGIRNTTQKAPFEITYDAARKAIDAMADQMRQDGKVLGLFGSEKDESFKSSLAAIYQTFDGDDLYPSIEEKAANLLYFVTKNHSFSDGNKRIAAAIFLWFLDKNRLLYSEDGRKRLGDNALVALTLMIAESKPQHKDIIIKVVVNLINKDNP
ncbi:MAG: RhuM family protein [Armatimonadota bacterium]